MSTEVAAILVNYNAGPLLLLSIESLLACSIVSEIIVVDNNSKDDSLAMIEHLQRIKIVRNSSNLGFATACNQGIQQSQSDYLLFLNPDCTFAQGTLIHITEFMRNDDRVGMAGGLLLNPDGSEQVGGRRAIPTPWRSFVRAFGLQRFANRWPRLFFDFNLYQEELPVDPIEVEALSGACMLVKRKAIEDVGLWDEGYFLHCEDLDWCMRFRQKGWKILFIPTARIVHEQGVCGRSRPIFVEWHKHKGMLRFYRKFFHHQYPGILMVLVTIGVWIRFLSVVGYYTFQRLKSYKFFFL